MDNAELDKIWKRQKEFHELLHGKVENIDVKQQLTKELILHLISECDEVLNSINWKMHRKSNKIVNKDNLKEELIDVFKYWLNISLIWDLSPEDFVNEFYRKSEVVEQRYHQEKQLDLVNDEKIIGVDIDGVLADYPKGFLNFIEKETGIKLNIVLKKYFLFDEVGKIIGTEKVKELKHKFRSSGEKRNLEVINNAKEGLNYLKQQGYTIVLLSARPVKQYNRIFPDTIEWLQKNNLVYDAILWDEKKEERILKEFPKMNFMIEDVLENANKVAEENYKVFLINTSYNQGETNQNVVRINDWIDLIKKLKEEKNG